MTDHHGSVWFNAAHCEWDGCDSWSMTPQTHGFLSVRWNDSTILYCSVDCLLKDMARHEPTETYDA